MNYGPDEFLDLIEAVESDGGVQLPRRHEPSILHYKMPTIDGPKWQDAFTTGCKREALFELPYDPAEPVMIPAGPKAEMHDVDRPVPEEAKAQLARGAGLVVVCAVDDNVGMWPRFKKAPNAN